MHDERHGAHVLTLSFVASGRNAEGTAVNTHPRDAFTSICTVKSVSAVHIANGPRFVIIE